MQKTHASNAPGAESARRDWRAVAQAWGPPGNARLTASTGLVLLALLAVETLTTLALRSYLPVHIFLGLLLVPPVGLKLASAGWRFLRYYTRNKPYRLEGPPRLLLRVLAPLLVASTLLLFGSGVALIVSGHGGGLFLRVHRLSFIAWGVLMVIHVIAYLTRALRLGGADWRRNAEQVVAGARSRRAVLSGALLAGIILALATYPGQQAWLSHRHDQRHNPGAGVGGLQTTPVMGSFSGLWRAWASTGRSVAAVRPLNGALARVEGAAAVRFAPSRHSDREATGRLESPRSLGVAKRGSTGPTIS